MTNDPSSSPFLAFPPIVWLASNDLTFAIADGFPVSAGHALLVPRRLVATWWEASREERIASAGPRRGGQGLSSIGGSTFRIDLRPTNVVRLPTPPPQTPTPHPEVDMNPDPLAGPAGSPFVTLSRKQHRRLQRTIDATMVWYPKEKLQALSVVDLPVGAPQMSRGVLLLSNARLIIKTDGYLQLECLLGDVASAEQLGETVAITLHTEGGSSRFRVRAPSPATLQRQLVDKAEEFLGTKPSRKETWQGITLVIGATLLAALERPDRQR